MIRCRQGLRLTVVHADYACGFEQESYQPVNARAWHWFLGQREWSGSAYVLGKGLAICGEIRRQCQDNRRQEFQMLCYRRDKRVDFFALYPSPAFVCTEYFTLSTGPAARKAEPFSLLHGLARPAA